MRLLHRLQLDQLLLWIDLQHPNSIPLRHRKAITHVGVARGSARGGQDENKQPRDRNSGA